MAMKRRGSVFCVLFFAAIFLLVSMAMLAVSLGTDHWQDITVDRSMATISSMKGSPLYFSRNRGMLRTCVPGNETDFFVDNPPARVVDGICYYDDGLYLPTSDTRKNWGKQVQIRDHCVRLQLGVFVTSLVIMLIAAFMACFACYSASHKRMLYVGVACLLAGVFAIGGMGTYHGIIYLEDQITDQIYGFSGYWDKAGMLGSVSTQKPGFSYALGWAASACTLVACLLFVIAGSMMREQPAPEKEKMVPPPYNIPQPMLVSQPPSIMQAPPPPPMVKHVPVPVPVPVPAYPTFPRPRPLPAIAYPSGTQSMRHPDTSLYQSQPPAYPGNVNFQARSLAYQ